MPTRCVEPCVGKLPQDVGLSDSFCSVNYPADEGIVGMRELNNVECGATMIDTHSPRQRHGVAASSASIMAAAGELDGYDLLRAEYADGGLEFFLMEDERPVAAVLMQPWDEPVGHIVRHASVEDSHRGRGLVRGLYLLWRSPRRGAGRHPRRTG